MRQSPATWIPCVGDRVRLLVNLIDVKAGDLGTISFIIDGRVRIKMDIDPRPGKPFYVEVMPRQIELVSPATSGSDSTSTPSSKSLGKKRRGKGFGSGSVHWRTVTRNGRDYRQAHYHWRENGKKRTKYIPKRLLETVLQAVVTQRPVAEILELLGHKKISPSNSELLGDISISPSKTETPSKTSSPSNLQGVEEISPSKEEIPSTDLCPSNLLGGMELSPSKEEIPSTDLCPSNLLGDTENCPSKRETPRKTGEDFLGDKSSDQAQKLSPRIIPEFLGDKSSPELSPRKDPELLEDKLSGRKSSEFLGDKSEEQLSGRKDSEFLGDKSGEKLSPRKLRRSRGSGSGYIYWRTVTKNGKDYQDAYYHYEFWSDGDRLVKSTKYIPKGKLGKVQKLEEEKAPVREILKVLGVIK